MAKLFNLAQMTTVTTGTGTITLGSAVAPFITFAAAGAIDNDTVSYSIIDGSNSEVGYGTYNSAGPTLTRNLRKSSTGALLNLSGNAVVRLTPGREDIINPDGSIAFAANLDMGSNNIINVVDPNNAQDAATKNYVDNALGGVTGTSHAPVTLGTANGLSLSGQQLSLGLSSGTSAGALSGSDWQLFFNKQAALGFTPENVANKTNTVRSSGTSTTLYPSESAVSGFVASSIANIPAAGGNIGSFLLSGGGVTWVTGYQFRVSAAQYYIQGVLYSSAEQLVTLTASDGTYDRIDVIVVNTSGQVDKVTGVATSSPSEPDIDPATQLQLAFIIVYAASSSPIINSQQIYAEDASSPTEWNWSSTGSTWNLASTNNPFAGTKDIEATNIGANAYIQGMATGTVNLGTYTQLNFYVRSKGTWNTGRGLYVAWYSNGVRKGNNVFLAHGFFNFNSDNTTDYQLISIPISQFAVSNGTTVNQLRFTRVGGNISFYLDEIVVTDSGLTATPVGLTQEQADARYVIRPNIKNIVVTTANVAATVGNKYIADISGLTANRNFILPTANVGDEIELNINVGNGTYFLTIIGDTGIKINGGSVATAWGYIHAAGITMKFLANSTTNWQIVKYEKSSELDYVEFTSNVSPTATTEGTANTVVTSSAIVYDGVTPIVIEFKSNNSRPDVSADNRNMTFWLYDGSSSIGQIGYMSAPSSHRLENIPIHLSRRLTPTAASHTYSIRASVNAGTGLVGAGVGGLGNSSPGYIRITKANP